MSQHSKQEVNWEFLLASSKSTLQAYEQSRLNFAANVRKEIAQLLDTWVDESSSALLARWLIERNLAAEAAAISTNAVSDVTEFKEPRTQPKPAPGAQLRPPCRIAPRAGTETLAESDKIFGNKSLAAERISATS